MAAISPANLRGFPMDIYPWMRSRAMPGIQVPLGHINVWGVGGELMGVLPAPDVRGDFGGPPPVPHGRGGLGGAAVPVHDPVAGGQPRGGPRLVWPVVAGPRGVGGVGRGL